MSTQQMISQLNALVADLVFAHETPEQWRQAVEQAVTMLVRQYQLENGIPLTIDNSPSTNS